MSDPIISADTLTDPAPEDVQDTNPAPEDVRDTEKDVQESEKNTASDDVAVTLRLNYANGSSETVGFPSYDAAQNRVDELDSTNSLTSIQEV